jgi:hypothetical protein
MKRLGAKVVPKKPEGLPIPHFETWHKLGYPDPWYVEGGDWFSGSRDLNEDQDHWLAAGRE